MLVAGDRRIVLQGPNPFVAVLVTVDAEQIGRSGFALRVVFAAVADVVCLKGISALFGQFQRFVGIIGRLFVIFPVQTDAGFESIGACASQTCRSVAVLVVADRQKVEHFVRKIFVENP